jgi:hypothetical protein
MPIPTPPSSKTHPTRHVPPIVWAGFTGIRGGQRITTKEFDNFLYHRHSATIATPSCCKSSARWGKRQQSTINNQPAMVAMDSMTATRWQRQWTARCQRDGNATATAAARQQREARRQHWQRGAGRGGASCSTAATGSRVAGQQRQWQHRNDSSSTATAFGSAAAAAAWRQRRQQRGGGSGSGGGGGLAAALWQHGGSAASLAVALQREVRTVQGWRRWQCIDGGRQCVGSAMETDIATAAAPTTMLSPIEVKINTVKATNKQ